MCTWRRCALSAAWSRWSNGCGSARRPATPRSRTRSRRRRPPTCARDCSRWPTPPRSGWAREGGQGPGPGPHGPARRHRRADRARAARRAVRVHAAGGGSGRDRRAPRHAHRRQAPALHPGDHPSLLRPLRRGGGQAGQAAAGGARRRARLRRAAPGGARLPRRARDGRRGGARPRRRRAAASRGVRGARGAHGRPARAPRAPLRGVPRAVARSRAQGLPGAAGVRRRGAFGGHQRPRYDRPAVSTVEHRPAADAIDLADPGLYFNRELSWLEFNQRVLELAEDPAVPLLERLKFSAIASNNLDEFFMVRVAGLHDQVDAGIETPLQDGRTPRETLDEIRRVVRGHCERQARCLQEDLRPALAEHGIPLVGLDDVSADERRRLDERFRRQIFPVLTPLAVGLGRPFPYISNLSLSLGIVVNDPVTRTHVFARVKVPTEMLPRFVALADGCTFVLLEELIAKHLDQLFPGMEIVDTAVFRVTRDADFTVSDEAADLLQAGEDELRRRRFGEVVRVEVEAGMSREMREQLVRALEAESDDVFAIDGPLDLNDLWDVVKVPGFAELRDPPWTPVTQPRLHPNESEEPSVMSAMREGDILVHHPYDSFATSVERLVEEAVADEDVLAIKQTVYRTSDDSPLVPALIRAAERGKQAVCLVELKARFDERANIGWARALEEAGVHVVYGHPALKTHAKCVLVVRREGDGVRHYLHIGTGNYHPKTARLYTDFGLFTDDQEIGDDVADMFNFLTGYARPRNYREVLVAPNHLRDGIIDEIESTIEAHRAGQQTRIRMKMSSLVDKRCIRALYAASQAGVPVELNIRGICCLKPGVEGISENIRVVSVVGRFLEHSRIYAFERGGDETMFIGSADLMPRNLDTRVELLAPVRDPALRADLLDTLERCFADDSNAWELADDGTWTRRMPQGPEPRSVQRELMRGHAARAPETAAAAG